MSQLSKIMIGTLAITISLVIFGYFDHIRMQKLRDPHKQKRVEITEFLKKHEMHKNIDTRQFEMISFRKLYQRSCIESYNLSYTFGKESILKFNLTIAGSNGDYCFYTNELLSYNDLKIMIDSGLDNPEDVIYPCMVCK